MRAWWVEILGLTALLGLAPMSASASDGLPVGSWQALNATSSVNERIEAEIRTLSSEIAAVYRPIARQLLRKAFQPCTRLAIWMEAGGVAIQCDAQKVAVAAPDGRPVSYTGHDGRTHELVLRQEDRSLIQRVVGERGSRTSRYYRQGDLLMVDVTIDSPRLPRAVTYSVAYR